MSDVTWIPAGLIGFKIAYDKPGGDPIHVPGAIMALRKGGDEVLFARSDDDQDDDGNYKNLEPMGWIPIDQFIANPVAIATEDDFVEDDGENLPPLTALPPAESPAKEPRKAGVKRRGE